MLRSKDFKALMPLLMALRNYGHDFDAASVLIDKICNFGLAKPTDASFDEKISYVSGLLTDINRRVIKLLWLWPSWKKKRWLPRLYWVGEEHFANTKAIELSMANVYFLRFAEANNSQIRQAEATKVSSDPTAQQKTAVADKKNTTRYEKCLADFLGHLVIRKRWNWRKMQLERVRYHSREVLALGKVLMNELDESTKFWLVNYFEKQLKIFVKMFPGVFGSNEAVEEMNSNASRANKAVFPNGQGWIAILEDVALQGAYGDFEKVCDTEAITIWLFLEHQKIKAEAK